MSDGLASRSFIAGMQRVAAGQQLGLRVLGQQLGRLPRPWSGDDI